MRAYSDDLRVSILRAVDAGRSRTAVARAYGVSRSTVLRYLKQRRTSGTIAPKPIPGRTPCLRPADYSALIAQLAAAPDATLDEHCRAWERAHGTRISPSTMYRTMVRLGWSRKRKTGRSEIRKLSA